MEQFEDMLRRALTTLSRLLDPAMGWLARLDFVVRQQLGQFGVPYNWVGPLVVTLWVIVAFMVLKVLPNSLRLVVLLLAVVLGMKANGMLPG